MSTEAIKLAEEVLELDKEATDPLGITKMMVFARKNIGILASALLESEKETASLLMRIERQRASEKDELQIRLAEAQKRIALLEYQVSNRD